MTSETPRKALAGRTALVTGGAGALGRAIAGRFAAEGARVVVADLNADAALAVAEQVAATSDVECLGLALDVADHGQVRTAARRIGEQFGTCDAIVVNAGVLRLAPALELTPEQWRSVIDVNLSGAFYTATEFARVMVDTGTAGSIVFTSSLFGLRGGRGNAAYSASKFGMLGLAQSMAAELAGSGIRVNSVCPGQVHTGMLDEMFERRAESSGRSAEHEAAAFIERIPAGALGSPDAVAKAFVYLSSDASEYVTGTSLLVDGGWQVG